ncbi:MAG: hypothetical protein LWX56_05105 [Ignavibacteria bacterium]|nr:hypothetical protein [Ignavibacteria bacterium]
MVANVSCTRTGTPVPQNNTAKDLLSSVQSNDSLINELKDAFNTFYVLHIIADQREFIWRFYERSPDLLSALISKCHDLQHISFTNSEIKAEVYKYISKTLENYNNLKKASADSAASDSAAFARFEKDSKLPRDQFEKFITTFFALSKYTDLTEDAFLKLTAKENFRKANEYNTYLSTNPDDTTSILKTLGSLIEHADNFQEKSIYQLELADYYVVHETLFYSEIDNLYSRAIQQYSAILDSGTYSLYLYEAWIKWRCVRQRGFGGSNWSDIPNNEYELEKIKPATTILKYLETHKNDKLAINQFFTLTTEDIERRFGQYKFGNQNVVEFNYLFNIDKQK